MEKIGIGVCARNEESTLVSSLNSIRDSVIFSGTLSWTLFVCVNGSTDTTLELLRSWTKSNPELSVDLIKHEEASLVEAQRAIKLSAEKKDIHTIIFFDADIVVEIKCIKELLKASASDRVKVCYAVSIPFERTKKTLVEEVLNQYDNTPTIFTARKHLHGRAFLIKNWYIPRTNPALLADDIFLSFDLLEKYGTQSIVRVENATVSFRQITTYGDFYKAFFRRKNEIRKCLALFPEFRNLPAEQVNKKIIWRKLFFESPRRLYLWAVFFMLKIFANFSFFLDSLSVLSQEQGWEPTMSSKKTIEKPLLILIEGLDCSGKKTVANLLQKKFINAGISCSLNAGSLNSKVYRLLSRLVSVYRFPNFIRSIVYSFEGIGERYWYKNTQTHIVLQISSPYRNWAYSYVNHNYLRVFFIKFIRKYVAIYDVIFYLTVPYAIRLERHENQVALGQNRDSLRSRFTGEKNFSAMETVIKRLFAESKYQIVEIETSSIDPHKIAQNMFDKILVHYNNLS